MISMRLSDAARSIGGNFKGSDRRFIGCSVDTRTLKAGELFVALKGPRFDGHDFLPQAEDLGAAGAVVEHDTGERIDTILVADARRALGQLAHCWRRQFELPVLAITGSNGKTTVKEILSGILSVSGETLASAGNLNNDLGVPLTLFRLGPAHRFAVIEMGANHVGEIASLCRLANPRVGVVTQCAPAHLEGFGSLNGVARAKGELFGSLPDEGVAVINRDDPYYPEWRATAGTRRCITFGLHPEADVRAAIEEQGPDFSRFRLLSPSGSVTVRLPLPGRHNVLNALAAGACALGIDIPLEAVGAGLRSAPAVAGRLQLKRGKAGCRILDDSYNANIGSVRAALEYLGVCSGERWLVFGDMGELGDDAPRLHRDVGAIARGCGVDRIYAVGDLSNHVVSGFGENAVAFASQEELARALAAAVHAGVTVLVKGSRAAKMELIVNRLLD